MRAEINRLNLIRLLRQKIYDPIRIIHLLKKLCTLPNPVFVLVNEAYKLISRKSELPTTVYFLKI